MKPIALTIPISSGSDPEPIEIDDAHEAVGEIPPDTCEYILFDLIDDQLQKPDTHRSKKEVKP